jgi:hypothetical protein
MSIPAGKRLTVLALILGIALAANPVWAESARYVGEGTGGGYRYTSDDSERDRGRGGTRHQGDPDGPSVDLPVGSDSKSLEAVAADPVGSTEPSPGIGSVWQKWFTGLLQRFGVR